MLGESTVITAGTRFVISDKSGDINPRTDEGFFAYDTRFLSDYKLLIQERPLVAVHSAQLDHSYASFYGVNLGRVNLPKGAISVVRDRHVADGFHEDLQIINHDTVARKLTIHLAFDVDFADLFEVRRGNVRKAGKVTIEERPGYELCFVYNYRSYRRETWIHLSEPVVITDRGAKFQVTLPPKECWSTCITVQPVIDQPPKPMECTRSILGSPFSPDINAPVKELSEDVGNSSRALRHVPTLETDDPDLEEAYQAAITDLHALAIESTPGQPILAAGLPWFMAVFGRDSIISAIQTKLLGPDLMMGTLRTLGAVQAKELDAFRNAEPGKIPHEIREGELSILGDMPHSCYYGSVDSTPLYLRLLLETYRWTGSIDLLRELLPQAEAAVQWMDKYGDLDGDGFLEYRSNTRLKTRAPDLSGQFIEDTNHTVGLRNQGWKDSDDSVSFAGGPFARGPIALAEVQGYAYEAKRSMAEIYRLLDRPKDAAKLDGEADKLKKNFEAAFWMPDKGFYAIALDGRKRQVNSISSNPGHCLWSGLIAEDKASKVVERLLAPDMFSGWGVRTLSSDMARYNPLSYHNGSIWPHDNSMIAAGMARYGFKKEAHTVAYAMLDAASQFPNSSLPELFAGYPRRTYSFPVPYPSANAPQAWACGAIIYFLETLLNVEVVDNQLVVHPRAAGGVRLHLTNAVFRGANLYL